MNNSGAAPAYRRMTVSQRRSQIISTALALFAQHRPDNVSLDGVATSAGVSRPLVYRYFPGGKQQLYEAALRSAADELEHCFAEPVTGPLTLRLVRALDRYLTFVDGHAAGFVALLQGGSVVETSRTHAIVDEVRRTAAQQILVHLGTGTDPGRAGSVQAQHGSPQPDPLAQQGPSRQLRNAVRTWITAVEAASLIWLDEGKQPPVQELRDGLVDHFVALLLVTAAHDRQTALLARSALALEEKDGPVGELVRRTAPVLSSAAHLL